VLPELLEPPELLELAEPIMEITIVAMLVEPMVVLVVLAVMVEIQPFTVYLEILHMHQVKQ
jgi:hypothetical protein